MQPTPTVSGRSHGTSRGSCRAAGAPQAVRSLSHLVLRRDQASLGRRRGAGSLYIVSRAAPLASGSVDGVGDAAPPAGAAAAGAGGVPLTFEAAGGRIFTCARTARGQLRVEESTPEGFEYVVVLPPPAAAALGELLRGDGSAAGDNASPSQANDSQGARQRRIVDGARAFSLSLGSAAGIDGNGSSNGAAAGGSLELRVEEEGRSCVTVSLEASAPRARLQALLDGFAGPDKAAAASQPATAAKKGAVAPTAVAAAEQRKGKEGQQRRQQQDKQERQQRLSRSQSREPQQQQQQQQGPTSASVADALARVSSLNKALSTALQGRHQGTSPKAQPAAGAGAAAAPTPPPSGTASPAAAEVEEVEESPAPGTRRGKGSPKSPGTAQRQPRQQQQGAGAAAPRARPTGKRGAATGAPTPSTPAAAAKSTPAADTTPEDLEQLLSDILAAGSASDVARLTDSVVAAGAPPALVFALWLRLPVVLPAKPGASIEEEGQALTIRLGELLGGRLSSASPVILLLVLQAAADLRSRLGITRPSDAWVTEWMQAAQPHLASTTPADLAATVERLQVLGAAADAEWMAAAAAAAAAALSGEEPDAAAGEAAAQLLAWSAAKAVANGASSDAEAAVLAALLSPPQQLAVPQLARLLRAVAALPSHQRAAAADAMWRWLLHPAATAADGVLTGDLDLLVEIIVRLPDASWEAQRPLSSTAVESPLLALLRGRAAAAVAARGTAEARAAAVAEVNAAVVQRTSAAAPAALAAWLPEALQLVADAPAGASDAGKACASTEAVRRIFEALQSVADRSSGDSAAAASANVLGPAVAALSRLLPALGALAPIGEAAAVVSALHACAARAQPAAAADGAIAAWLRAAAAWVRSHGSEADVCTLATLLASLAELSHTSADAAAAAESVAPGWLAIANAALLDAEVPDNSRARLLGEADLVAATAALLRLGGAPSEALLLTALQTAQAFGGSKPLLDSLPLLESAAAANGGVVPESHAAQARDICGALLSIKPEVAASSSSYGPAALLRATRAALRLGARARCAAEGGNDATAALPFDAGLAVEAALAGQQAFGGAAVSADTPWEPPVKLQTWLAQAWCSAAEADSAAGVVSQLPPADCAALAAALGHFALLEAPEGGANTLQSLAAAAAESMAAAPRASLPPGAAVAGVLGLLVVEESCGDVGAPLLACAAQLADRAAGWALPAQLQLLHALPGGSAAARGGAEAGASGTAAEAAGRLVAALLSGLEASLSSVGSGGDSNAASPSSQGDQVAAAPLLGALQAAQAAGGSQRLPRQAARRLLGRIEAAYAEAAAAAGPSASLPGWPEDAALQYAQACCAHGVAPAPGMLRTAIAQAAAAPPGTLAPLAALDLLLTQPKRTVRQSGTNLGARASSEATTAEDAAAVLGRHLQAHLGELSAPQLHRLLSAAVALGAPPPPGFAAAAEAALAPRLLLLPKGRHLLDTLEALLAWGHHPGPAFMRSFHGAADALLDTFSVRSGLQLLEACWTAAAPATDSPGNTGAAAVAPLPPPGLVAELLRSLEGRSVTPQLAAEGLRLLGRLRVRPSPPLLLSWFAAGVRDGALRELPPRLILSALRGACELRAPPPAAWLDEVLEGLTPRGHMSACAPETLAGILLELQRLGVTPLPAVCAAAAEAAAAGPEAAWDAESLSVLLAALATWGAAPPAGAARVLARRAAGAAVGADPASAARLFLWWQALRSHPDAALLLADMPPEDLFSIDLTMWGATACLFPAPGEPLVPQSDRDAALPRGALAPLLLAAIAAAKRSGAGDPDSPAAPGLAPPPAWLERAWCGAAAAAAAADALTANEAAALLLGTILSAPGVHLWDMGTAQAVLRAGYRARAGACGEALNILAWASEAMGQLIKASPEYAASWAEALRRSKGASIAAEGGAPGLPAACAQRLAADATAVSDSEAQAVWTQYAELAAGLGAADPAVAAAEGWGTPEHMWRFMEEQGLLSMRGVRDDVDDMHAALVEDVSALWIERGFDDD